MFNRGWASLSQSAAFLQSFVRNDAILGGFVGGACWSVGSATIARGMTLAAAIISARLLGNVGYGKFGMIQSTLVLFGAFAGTGLGVTLTRHVAQLRNTDINRAQQALAFGLLLAVIAGTLIGTVLFLLSETIARSMLNAPHLARELKIGTGLVLLTVITGTQTGSIAGLQEFRALAIVNVNRAVCITVALVVGSWYGVTGAVIGLVGAEAISVVLNAVVLRKIRQRLQLLRRWRPFQWQELRDLCAFALPVFLSGVVMQPAQWVSNAVLVNQPYGYAGLGIFIAAVKLREVILFVPTSISQTVLACLSNLHGTKNANAYARFFKMNVLVHVALTLIPAILLVLLSRQAMLLYGPEFQQGWITVSILAVSAVPFVLNNILGQVLQAGGRIWYRFALDIVLAGVFAVLAMALIPRYQENGLALAYLVAFTVIAVILYWVVRPMLRQPLSAPKVPKENVGVLVQ